MTTGKREDPMEKLARMMDERIAAAFEGQDRKAKEEKDPWARLEGMIDRAVAKHVAALGEDAEESKRRVGKPKADDDEGEDGEPFKLGILGM